jgi:predicted DNA-binding protein
MPKAADKATISVVIPKEALERLKKLAEEKDWSVSQTAKNLIVEGLERVETEGKESE